MAEPRQTLAVAQQQDQAAGRRSAGAHGQAGWPQCRVQAALEILLAQRQAAGEHLAQGVERHQQREQEQVARGAACRWARLLQAGGEDSEHDTAEHDVEGRRNVIVRLGWQAHFVGLRRRVAQQLRPDAQVAEVGERQADGDLLTHLGLRLRP